MKQIYHSNMHTINDITFYLLPYNYRDVSTLLCVLHQQYLYLYILCAYQIVNTLFDVHFYTQNNYYIQRSDFNNHFSRNQYKKIRIELIFCFRTSHMSYHTPPQYHYFDTQSNSTCGHVPSMTNIDQYDYIYITHPNRTN